MVTDGLNIIWHYWVLTLLDFTDVRHGRGLYSAMGVHGMPCILWTCQSSWLVACTSDAPTSCLVIRHFWWGAGR